MLGLAGCDDRHATSDHNVPATDAPMTGGSVASSPPATTPATQPAPTRIDPQAIPADRAGLKDHASDQVK